MSDNALAIKYRPQQLSQVIGQPGAIAKIKGWAVTGRIPTCILVSGSTGTGKTTLSGIIAKRFSKYKGTVETNPDYTDQNVGADGTIGDIREMIHLSKLSPRGGVRRIIVLDEAHALSKASTNALLKVLEAGTSKTTWILCTDQPHKLPNALIGRCSAIRLEAVKQDDLVELMQRVLTEENIKLKNKDTMLAEIAKAAFAQPRLGLQILDSVCTSIAGGGDPKDALKDAIQSNPIASNFDIAISYLKAWLDDQPAKAIKAISAAQSADGILDMISIMLESIVLRAAGAQPNTPLGWASIKQFSFDSKDLPRLLGFQIRLVAAMDLKNRYTVQQMHILMGLTRIPGG